MNPLITNYLEDAIDELSHKARRYYHDYKYYVGANGIREILINTLKSRSEFKRTLKEYKKQCELIELVMSKKSDADIQYLNRRL